MYHIVFLFVIAEEVSCTSHTNIITYYYYLKNSSPVFSIVSLLSFLHPHPFPFSLLEVKCYTSAAFP